jgi:glycosyltransferase involved in cell wall biosynthesis
MDNVSVIIRNKNEEQYIGFAIQSVIDHLEDPEIIVVDNNSVDESLEIVNSFSLHNNVKVTEMQTYSPGKALNKAVSQATRETILILSAHAQITKLNMDYVKQQLNNNVAVFGKQVPIFRGKKITPRYIWSHFGDRDVINMMSPIEDRQFLHNAFCFYNRQFLGEHPFDESLVGKEDRYWAIDVVSNNYTYLYTPVIEVNHFWTPNGATWKGLD